jgi:hypothetical protein
MKTFVRSLAMATIISSPFLLTGCGNASKANVDSEVKGQSAQDSAVQQNGVCPMHPEVAGQVGETCPKCGMKLELVSAEKAANKNEYFMDFKAVPAVHAGEASEFVFTPSIIGKTERVPLEVQHDKKIHLIIVSKDLSYFDHVHPELQSDGSYKISVLRDGVEYTKGKFHNETKFTQGGDYVLFADYLPTGANHQVERIELYVAGNTWPARKYITEKLVSETDGYEVSLVPEGGEFFNEGSTHMEGIIRKNGVEIPADKLEDFLAAKAHVVMISEDSKDYLHVHPEVDSGRLSLHTEFGKTGVFRGWLQFRSGGEIHTADFVVNVKAGKAPQHGQKKHMH